MEQQGSNPFRLGAARLVLMVSAALSAAIVGGGCAKPPPQVSARLQVFSAERPMAELLANVGNGPADAECWPKDGPAKFYSLSHYQMARIGSMAKEAKLVERSLEHEASFRTDESLGLSLKTRHDEQLAIDLNVYTEACCGLVIGQSSFALTDAAGTSRADFACQMPNIGLLAVELPPTAEGRRRTWIILELQKLPGAEFGPRP
jgi:hypothetical protein